MFVQVFLNSHVINKGNGMYFFNIVDCVISNQISSLSKANNTSITSSRNDRSMSYQVSYTSFVRERTAETIKKTKSHFKSVLQQENSNISPDSANALVSNSVMLRTEKSNLPSSSFDLNNSTMSSSNSTKKNIEQLYVNNRSENESGLTLVNYVNKSSLNKSYAVNNVPFDLHSNSTDYNLMHQPSTIDSIVIPLLKSSVTRLPLSTNAAYCCVQNTPLTVLSNKNVMSDPVFPYITQNTPSIVAGNKDVISDPVFPYIIQPECNAEHVSDHPYSMVDSHALAPESNSDSVSKSNHSCTILNQTSLSPANHNVVQIQSVLPPEDVLIYPSGEPVFNDCNTQTMSEPVIG